MLSQAITAALVLIGLALAAITTRAVRQGQLSTRSTRIGAVICGIGLAAMLLSDYPYAGNRFWADHSVLAAILSSLLLVGVVFLAYETQERTEQHRLASSLSGAGLGGIVDHVVDAEVALALATAPTPPDVIRPDHWSNWAEGGRPLRWLRQGRNILGSSDDPQLQPIGNPTSHAWTRRLHLRHAGEVLLPGTSRPRSPQTPRGHA